MELLLLPLSALLPALLLTLPTFFVYVLLQKLGLNELSPKLFAYTVLAVFLLAALVHVFVLFPLATCPRIEGVECATNVLLILVPALKAAAYATVLFALLLAVGVFVYRNLRIREPWRALAAIYITTYLFILALAVFPWIVAGWLSLLLS